MSSTAGLEVLRSLDIEVVVVCTPCGLGAEVVEVGAAVEFIVEVEAVVTDEMIAAAGVLLGGGVGIFALALSVLVIVVLAGVLFIVEPESVLVIIGPDGVLVIVELPGVLNIVELTTGVLIVVVACV